MDEAINEKFKDLVESTDEVNKPLPQITEDDEVFVLQIPKTIDVRSLKSATFGIGTKNCDISTEEVTYKCNYLPTKKTIHIADAGRVRQVEIEGMVRVKGGISKPA